MANQEQKKERQNPKFFVVIWGEPDPALISFDTKRELDEWLNDNGITVHKKDHMAGRGFLQDAEGKPAIIIKGHLRIIKQTVSLF
ncbi:hypothetical protein GWN42_24080 [candidate division KSB1 bacterium]|nr:hypothetical protein [Phycisphaerae bacterium]NIV95786.1 hypothetical protein [candidate division KSB1 bacterium]